MSQLLGVSIYFTYVVDSSFDFALQFLVSRFETIKHFLFQLGCGLAPVNFPVEVDGLGKAVLHVEGETGKNFGYVVPLIGSIGEGFVLERVGNWLSFPIVEQFLK